MNRLLERTAERCPTADLDRLRQILDDYQWALWATLYVDASNAGGGPGAWAWGARGRISDEVAAVFGVEPTFHASGPTPQAKTTLDSGIAELWGIYHALQYTLAAWPFVVGLGVRCDNLGAVEALAGCDGRRGPRPPKRLAPAHAAIAKLVQSHDVLLRGVHVRGHGRADTSQRRAFNGSADSLARRAARQINSRGSDSADTDCVDLAGPPLRGQAEPHIDGMQDYEPEDDT